MFLVSLFTILVLIKYIPWMMKSFTLQRYMDTIKLLTQTIQMKHQLIMNIFFICDCLIDRILETDQNSDIVLKVINKDVSFLSINGNGTYS